MTFMYRYCKGTFSIVSISVVGSVFHNIGQILIASIVVSNINLFFYLPTLLIAGVIMGIFIGLTVQYTMKPLSNMFKINGE